MSVYRLMPMSYADATFGLRRHASTTNGTLGRGPSNSGRRQVSSSADVGAGQTPGRQTLVSRESGDDRLRMAP